MVRDKNTIYAELNDEDTVLAAADSNELVTNGLILGAGDKFVKHKIVEDLGSIIYLVNGQVRELKIQPNKRLGVDADGNLAWL